MQETAKKLAQLLCFCASEKKAQDIMILDMEGLTSATDSFVICSGKSVIQVRAIVDFMEEKMAEAGYTFLHKEGYQTAEWVLLDYGDCVAHVFIEEAREYYALERLWSQAPATKYEEKSDE